jgi:hypothetical protein
MEEGSGICLLGQLIAQGCAGANEGCVAPVTFILNMVHAGVEGGQRPAAEGAEYCPARRPEHTPSRHPELVSPAVKQVQDDEK